MPRNESRLDSNYIPSKKEPSMNEECSIGADFMYAPIPSDELLPKNVTPREVQVLVYNEETILLILTKGFTSLAIHYTPTHLIISFDDEISKSDRESFIRFYSKFYLDYNNEEANFVFQMSSILDKHRFDYTVKCVVDSQALPPLMQLLEIFDAPLVYA